MTYWPSVGPGAAWQQSESTQVFSLRLRVGRGAGLLASSRMISADGSIGPLGYHLFGLVGIELRDPGADH